MNNTDEKCRSLLTKLIDYCEITGEINQYPMSYYHVKIPIKYIEMEGILKYDFVIFLKNEGFTSISDLAEHILIGICEPVSGSINWPLDQYPSKYVDRIIKMMKEQK